MQNKKKIVFWISFLIFVLCFAFVVTWIILKEKNNNVYDKMQDMNDSSDYEKPNILPEDDSVVATSEPVEIPIDFVSLQEENPEIYAWIRIPDTNVDYPILQRPHDDSYYLNHTADGSAGLPGSIYTESLNNTDFSDRNTVIYGHDMRDKSMFGGLSDYKSSEYMKEHPYIYIYTPGRIYTYEIFGAVTYDNRHILRNFDFSSDSGLQEFLDSIRSVRNMNTYINEDVEVTASDRIITLSTCNGNESQRFLVEAVLIDEK